MFTLRSHGGYKSCFNSSLPASATRGKVNCHYALSELPFAGFGNPLTRDPGEEHFVARVTRISGSAYPSSCLHINPSSHRPCVWDSRGLQLIQSKSSRECLVIEWRNFQDIRLLGSAVLLPANFPCSFARYFSTSDLFSYLVSDVTAFSRVKYGTTLCSSLMLCLCLLFP